MKRNISIQLKAALLLVIFALNIVVGFACSVGMDMGFNTHHHEEEATAVSIHIHEDSENHEHHNEAGKHHQHEKNDNDKKDDCCNDKVLQLSQTDKSLPHSGIIINPVFFTAFTTAYYSIDIFFYSQVSLSNKYYVLGHHPPIPDIRIAIQSFQI
jgi:hypothetical protein